MIPYIPYIPYELWPYIPYLSYLSCIPHIAYIWNIITTPPIHTIPNIHAIHTIPTLHSKHAIPTIVTIQTIHTVISNIPYPTDLHTIPTIHTVPHPHHTTGGEGDSTMADPWPWRGEGGLERWTIYTYVRTYIPYITLHFRNITFPFITLYVLTLPYITLHYLTLLYITLHYITYIRIYINYFLCKHTSIYIHKCIYVYTCIYIYIFICKYIYIYITCKCWHACIQKLWFSSLWWVETPPATPMLGARGKCQMGSRSVFCDAWHETLLAITKTKCVWDMI